MAKFDIPTCSNEAVDTIKELAISVCDWHSYAHHNEIGWLGKLDEDDVKNTIPKIKDEGDVLRNNE